MDLYEFYQSGLEFGEEAIDDDKELAKHVQRVLVWLKLLDPPADGEFASISMGALTEFQELMSQKIPELTEEKGFLGNVTAKALIETSPDELPQPKIDIGNDKLGRIIKYIQKEGYKVFTKPGEYNIVYVEGMNPDLSLNDDRPDYFNDLRMVIEFKNGKPEIIGKWEATTEPGKKYTYSPLNSKGAARIKFGQYKAWRVGTHKNHQALVQVKPVTVYRDFNKDFKRTGDRPDTGLFGINQHWGYDYPKNSIAGASAGCLVGRTRQGHRDFMAIIKQDQRYKQNHNYIFYTTIIPGDDLD